MALLTCVGGTAQDHRHGHVLQRRCFEQQGDQPHHRDHHKRGDWHKKGWSPACKAAAEKLCGSCKDDKSCWKACLTKNKAAKGHRSRKHAETHRGRGLGRVMLDHAERRARALGRPALVLQTRVELVENHAAFARMGFAETGRTAHAGYDRPTSVTFTRHLD